MTEPKPTSPPAPVPLSSSSHVEIAQAASVLAPVIFFEGAPTFGHLGDIIRVVLATIYVSPGAVPGTTRRTGQGSADGQPLRGRVEQLTGPARPLVVRRGGPVRRRQPCHHSPIRANCYLSATSAFVRRYSAMGPRELARIVLSQTG